MVEPPISPQEFAARRAAAAKMAAERGFEALVIWSRNATTVDWYGDVMYLSNHHSGFPQQPDNPPHWSGRGHSVLILPVEGEPVLISDTAEYREDLISVEDVRVALHIPSLVAEVLHERGLASSPLGLVGRESLLLRSYELLCEELGETPDLTFADDLLDRLRMIKSPAEQELMRRAAAIGVETMGAMIDAVSEGVTEADIAGEGWRTAARLGAFPYDTAITSGPHSSQYQWARMPSWDVERRLQGGDLFHVDLYGPAVEGYWTDFVRSAVVGGEASKAQAALLEGSIEHVETIIASVRPGATFGDLWGVGERWRQENGFGAAAGGDEGQLPGLDAMFPAFGHCIGLGGGEPPYITEGATEVIEEGMVIAVETLLSRSGVGGSGFEQDVIVTADGYEVLTEAAPARSWK